MVPSGSGAPLAQGLAARSFKGDAFQADCCNADRPLIRVSRVAADGLTVSESSHASLQHQAIAALVGHGELVPSG